MKLTEMQKGLIVAIILSDMASARDQWGDIPSEEQTARANKLSDWLEEYCNAGKHQPLPHEFFELALEIGEAAVNDQLEVTDGQVDSDKQSA